MVVKRSEGPETIILSGRMLTTVKQDQPNSHVIVCDRLSIDFWTSGILEITIEQEGMRWREYHNAWCEVRYAKREIKAKK